jgi:hypothetical protein
VHDTSDDDEHPPRDDQGPLDDPYVIGPLRGALPKVAPVKIAATPQAPRLPRVRRATLVNVALGLALVLSWGTGIVLLVQRVTAPPPEPVAAVASPPRRVLSRPSARAAAAGPRAPATTTTLQRGDVTVVDVGIEARSLADELARQRTIAQDAHETMLVMTTVADCGPCASVFSELTEPRMQAALSRVRLVRVYAEVFRDDLDSLQIPRAHFPGFFVLGPDLRPRDGIDGGEWDDDVAENIAPVLEAFVRGTLTKRRTPWQALPGSGMRL